MRKKIDYFKAMTGKKLSEIHHSYQQDFVSYWNCKLNSMYKPILLGRDVETGKPFYASLEQLMNHLSIMAPSKKGKSTLLLYLMMQIISRGFGCALIDPSEGGDTAYKLVKFCQQIGKKYLLIDLNRLQNPVLNPFHENKYESVTYLVDAFKVLFSVQDLAETPLIAKYLQAIMHVLWNAGLTVVEAKYFTSRIYEAQQQYILQKSAEAEKKSYYDSHHRILIEEALAKESMRKYFISTTSRLEPLNHPALQALVGDPSSIDLRKFIADNGVIIMVSSLRELEELQVRLANTIVINEIVSQHPGNNFWLFIDEARDYTTSKVGELLDKKAKTGLNVGLLYHHLDQFEDRRLRKSVEVNTHIKFDLLKKREAWTTLNEMDSVYLRIPELNAELGTPKASSFNRRRADVLKNIRQRIPYESERISIEPPAKRTVANRETIDHSKDRPKTIFDD